MSFTLLSVIAIAVVLVSCGGNAQNNSDQQVAELQSQIAELQQQVNNQQGQGQGIDVEQAKSIAVQHAGFNMSNVTFVKQQYDFDDGIAKWEIEFVNGTNKYEYEIAASNGSVFKFKVESIYND